MKLKRPGCVLLQAAMGGSSIAAQQFPPRKWVDVTRLMTRIKRHEKAKREELDPVINHNAAIAALEAELKAALSKGPQ